MSPPSSNSELPPSKKVLYCFECGHESPIGGDWIVEQVDDRDEYRCPVCDTTINVRPRSTRRPNACPDARCC